MPLAGSQQAVFLTHFVSLKEIIGYVAAYRFDNKIMPNSIAAIVVADKLSK